MGLYSSVDWHTIATYDDKNVMGFFGDYRYLSNYHEEQVWYEGRKYRSNEHAYQAAKTHDEGDRAKHFGFDKTCAEVKRNGGVKAGLIVMRPDWESVKYDVMAQLCFQKFLLSATLRAKLLDTGDRYLEETNWWNDRCWGVCKGQGTNWLGKILMQTREFLKTNP